MNRTEKATAIDTLKAGFGASNAAFLVGFQGLTVTELQSLRKDLRSQGGRFKVSKARLMRLAAQGIPEAEVMLPFFKEQVGIVFADQDIAGIAKVLKEFAKEHEKLVIVAGSLDQQLLDKIGVERIATLPPREVLLGQVCGTLIAPVRGLVVALNMMQCKLLWTLKQIEQKKQ
jgi:large subunit ribosomal protein L10